MPTFNASQLNNIAVRILKGAQVALEDAEIVASELVEANLVGHDSHGVIRLMQYVDYLENGFIKPKGEFQIVREGPSFAIVDGNFHFGQVTLNRALRVGMDKARQTGTATVMVRNGNHVGRLGSYARRAAMDGMAIMIGVDTPGIGGVAPFGGMDRRMGTNPISIAAPRHDEPVVLDMTSSATAEGKLRVAFQKGEKVPEGLIIDAHGNPSTEPADFYADPPGALLPLGGDLGFKGFGLSVMIDCFAGILSGNGVCRSELPPGMNGVWLYLLDIEQFVSKDDYTALVENYIAFIKSSRKMPGVDEILMPGEIELRRRRQREAEGVLVADRTWRELRQLANRLKVSLDAIE